VQRPTTRRTPDHLACELRVVGRNDFIAMKLFAHGPQDCIDAQHALLAAGEVPDLERLLAR